MEKETPDEKMLSILKNSKLFNQFDDNQLIKLIALSRIEHFEQGTIILQEGTHNENLYLLVDGNIAVYVGDERILNLRRVGDIIGEMSVITKSLTTASVIADTQATLFVISSESIYDSNNHDLQSLWFKLFSDILSDKLVTTNKRLIGYHATSEELNSKKQELVQKTMIMQSIMSSMSDGVVVTDDKGNVLHVNDAFIKMVGIIDLPLDYQSWPETIGFFKPDGKTLYTASEISIETSIEIKKSEEIEKTIST
ncbi:MAG: cyclic nucleotide-binding domain-containing protein, partial [Desulfamplus sp.]|nr:cyclic nucleotide-binding domain-containing protein [Desulfamplus sp.]